MNASRVASGNLVIIGAATVLTVLAPPVGVPLLLVGIWTSFARSRKARTARARAAKARDAKMRQNRITSWMAIP